ncbi:uncharacterized protein KY384_006357 [Bacidia gigantensis]|uniref:uncharacterized protein n=1 Tax=Bacidia gigantensis TaxID=2732470 RepID=UPI001D04D737|nr:uncharacterized protein KY384_006357 [Bacidia gigantensis]KAG8528670.1 hypothetical protein KY384_006357 [Bacidia gigantensis]
MAGEERLKRVVKQLKDDPHSDHLFHVLKEAGIFDEDGVRPIDTITPQELQSQIKALVCSIFDDWEDLRKYVHQHGLKLEKRWSGKNSDKRKKILLNAFGPEISNNHRPDLDALKEMQYDFHIEKTSMLPKRKEVPSKTLMPSFGDQQLIASEDAMMLPQINLEDLVKRETLLLLMDARSQAAPSRFVLEDRETMKIGKQLKSLKDEQLSGVLISLIGQETRSTYGTMLPFQALSSGSQTLIMPGDALLVLKSQARLLGFLINCCRTILHDQILEETMSPPIPMNIKPMIDDEEPEDLALRLLFAPYRLPKASDFARIQTLVSAKCAELQDHLWALHEDPGYVYEVLQECSDCQYESLAWTGSGINPLLSQQGHWNEVITQVLRFAYIHSTSWVSLRDDLQQLEILSQYHSDQIKSGQDMPKEYEDLLGSIQYRFADKEANFSKALLSIIAAARAFRHSFSFQRSNTKGAQWRLTTVFDKRDHLWWLLSNLSNPDSVKFWILPDLINEVERLTSTDPNERERLSPQLARWYSELSVVTELACHLCRLPGGSGFLSSAATRIAATKSQERSRPIMAVRQLLSQDMGVADYGANMTRFPYPAEKKRNTATSLQMRAAEQNLDLFWQKIDSHFLKHTGRTLHEQAPLHSIIEPRQLRRTPVWKEPEFRRPRPQRKADEDPLQALAMLELRTERTMNGTSQPIAREKLKARALTVGEMPPEISKATEPPTQEAAIPRVKLNKRGLQAFATLFYIQHGESLARELRWTEFLFAMTAAGFSNQKLYGSAWLFERNEGNPRKSIIFHEPHKDPKIPRNICRRMAGRLERAFGWTRNVFVET